MSVIKRKDNTEKILFERKRIDLTTPDDHLTVLVFLISLAVCLVAGAVCLELFDVSVLDLAMFVTMPLVVVGALQIVRSRYKWYLVIVIAAVVAMLVMGAGYVNASALALISVGIAGVVRLVAVAQRFLFYRVVSSVEYLNVRTDLSLWDRVVAFVFNISGDLDTRNLEIDENVKRASLPWGEIWASMKVSFLIGVFIWIYLSMNPSWMQFESLSNVPVYMFAVMMYIPLIVLPFSIFMSLNVRIETRYRDFKIYDGIKGTLMRMAIPIFAAFMYILVAVNKNGFQDVLVFIVMSVAFNLVITVASCLVYYKGFESRVIDSIISHWNSFRPVQMLMGVKGTEDDMREDVPGTPVRDYSDLGELVFPD